MIEEKLRAAVELIENQFPEGDISRIPLEFHSFGQEVKDFNVVAIDGSFLPFYMNHDCTAHLFRVAWVQITEKQYQYSSNDSVHVISKNRVVDENDAIVKEIFEVAKKPSDQATMIQELKERELLLSLAEKMHETLFFVDGSLYFQKYESRLPSHASLMKRLPESCLENNNSFVGISKTSDLKTICPPHLDVEILEWNKRGEVGFINTNMNWNAGQVYFTRFNKEGNFHRVDVISRENPAILFNTIAKDADYPLMPGYPLLLIEAHRYAKLIRDLKDYYCQQFPLRSRTCKLPNQTNEIPTEHETIDRATSYKR